MAHDTASQGVGCDMDTVAGLATVVFAAAVPVSIGLGLSVSRRRRRAVRTLTGKDSPTVEDLDDCLALYAGREDLESVQARRKLLAMRERALRRRKQGGGGRERERPSG